MPHLQTGYKSYLTITERDEIHNILKEKINKLTVMSKKMRKNKHVRTISIQRILFRKRKLARIYSKMEHLDAYHPTQK